MPQLKLAKILAGGARHALACGMFLALSPAPSIAQQAVQGLAVPLPAEQFATIDRTGMIAPAADFAALETIARDRGTVRAIVGLRILFTPEGALSGVQAATQHNSITRATADVRHALANTKHRLIHTYETVPYIALELTPAALQRLKASGLAATLHQDVLRRPALSQSTDIVEAKEAHVLSRGGAGKVVAILDTGVGKAHPFLQHAPGVSKVLSEACFSGGSDCPGGVSQGTGVGSGVPCTYAPLGCRHGTLTAGIAAGKGTSFTGVARGARLISIQIFSRFQGTFVCGPSPNEDPCALSATSDQLSGLQRVFALRNTFSIASALLAVSGGQFTSACDSDPLKAAIDNLRSAGIATVIPSGNDGFVNAVGAPGCISTAVTVGATDKSDFVTDFSNSGALVDFFAPGHNINSSVPGGGFSIQQGTSLAAAHVAGAWAIAKQVKPAATVAEVQQALVDTGKPVTDIAANPDLTRDRIRIFSAAANLAPTGLNVSANFGPLVGGNLASDGVGLARRTNANDNPTTPPVSGNFQITGIPVGAHMVRAYVVYQTIGGPDASFTFKGTARTATLIGGSGQFTCWQTNNGGAYRTYRYVVPNGQVTGNGLYSIGGVGGTNSPIKGRADGQGASLIVVYDVPSSPLTGRVYLRFGSITVRTGQPAVSHQFTGLTVPSNTVSRALHVGIGDGETFADPPMRFAGTAITASNFWSGAEGPYWDDDRLSLAASLLPAGTTARTVQQGATGECLTWTYSGLTYQN